MALKDFLRRLTVLDRAIVFFLLLFCGGLFYAVGLREPGRSVVVRSNQQVFYKAPLNENRAVELPGPLGRTRLEISGGAARIVASPCPYKICIGMGPVRRRGEIIACVPNRLIVQVTSPTEEKESDYDLLSR